MEEDIKTLGKADPSQQESLDSEAIPDPMEGEQTWPTEEELAEAEGKHLTYCKRIQYIVGTPFWKMFKYHPESMSISTIKHTHKHMAIAVKCKIVFFVAIVGFECQGNKE